MATIAQRLLAAGASPERARAFEQQFTQKLQTAQPSLKKPQDIQDAFDAEIAAFAAATWPNTFRPPAIDDPRIDAYIAGIYGPNKLQQIETKAWDTEAPNFSKVSRSIINADPTKYNLDQYIVSKIQEGVSYAELVNDIIDNKMDLMGALTAGKVGDITTKYFNEYNKAAESVPTYKEKLLQSNKYYKFGLPDPKFKYGIGENLEKGVIDFRTHPSVARIISEGKLPRDVSDVITRRPDVRQREIESLYNDFMSQTKASPFSDEVKRREFLKKRTIK